MIPLTLWCVVRPRCGIPLMAAVSIYSMEGLAGRAVRVHLRERDAAVRGDRARQRSIAADA